MKIKQFIISLIIAIISSLGIFYFLDLFFPIGIYSDFMIISLSFFVLYNILVYMLGSITSKNKSKLFMHLVIYNVFFKMVLSFLIVYLYVLKSEPTDKFFIIPFILVYLIFTIFETYFLDKQAKYTSYTNSSLE